MKETILPRLKPHGKRRLKQLIEFLKPLPKNKFAFGTVIEKRKCGTIGCAIGWTPSIFPRLVKVVDDDFWGLSVQHRKTGSDFYPEVGSALFSISADDADRLFSPNRQREVHESLPKCGVRAKPTLVALMLEKFIELTETEAK